MIARSTSDVDMVVRVGYAARIRVPRDRAGWRKTTRLCRFFRLQFPDSLTSPA